MDEACGSDNDGHETYVVELFLVDLSAIGEKEQASALRSRGAEDEDMSDAWLAVCCYEYGLKAPLESWSGNAYGKLLRAARSLAHTLKRDADATEDRLERTVNRSGSTAREYMSGDIDSAILRGVSEGRPDAELMLKLGMGGK